jgi:hypothetical protein
MLEWLANNWLALIAAVMGISNLVLLAIYQIKIYHFANAVGEAVLALKDLNLVLTDKVNECVDLVNEPVKVTVQLDQLPATNVKPTKGMN